MEAFLRPPPKHKTSAHKKEQNEKHFMYIMAQKTAHCQIVILIHVVKLFF